MEGLRNFLFRVSFASPDCQFSSYILPSLLMVQSGFSASRYSGVSHVIFICLHSKFSITEGRASFSPRAEDLLLVPSLPSCILLVTFLYLSTVRTQTAETFRAHEPLAKNMSQNLPQYRMAAFCCFCLFIWMKCSSSDKVWFF